MGKGGRKRMFKTPEEMQAKIDAYFKDCEGTVLTDGGGNPVLNKFEEPIIVGAKPLTITGLTLALGFTSRQSLLNYQARGAFGPILEAAKLRVENYAEMRLYDRDGCNGARFNLQNNFRAWDADKPQAEDKKTPAINIICDIPKVATDDTGAQSTFSIDPQSVNNMLNGLKKEGGADGG